MQILDSKHREALLNNNSGFVIIPGTRLKTPIEVQYIFENDSVIVFSSNKALHSLTNIARMSIVNMPHTPESFVLYVHGERFLIQTVREISEIRKKFFNKFEKVLPVKGLYYIRITTERTEIREN